MLKKTKLIIVETSITPYREPLYKKIDEIFDCFWIFTQETEYNIKNTFLKNKKNYYIPKKIKFKNLVPLTFIFYKLLKLRDYKYILSTPGIYPECWQAFLFAKLFNKKLILRDEEFEWKKSWKRKLIMPLTKFINKKSNYILVPTDKHFKWQLKLWVNKNKIKLFPNVTNLNPNNINLGKVEELKQKYKIWNKKVIMYVWRLVEEKWVQYLINAYYYLIKENEKYKKDTILIIIWDWDYRENLEKLWEKIKNIWGNIIFTWKIDNKNLINYYELAYLWVVPSININWRWEAYALVLNEYMILWKPVIATNMVGASYALLKNNKILEHFITEEKNNEQIREKLEYLLDLNKNEYKNIQSEIFKKIRKYNDYSNNIKILRNIIV